MATAKSSTSSLQSGIYAIRYLANGRVYVGQASNIPRRWAVHRSELRKSKHANSLLQRSWNKYGAGQFVFEVLEYVDLPIGVPKRTWKALLTALEQEYIDKFDATNRQLGFNLCPTAGSSLGVRYSAEVRARRLTARRSPTPETKAKISAALKGRQPSPDVRAKISAARKGWQPSAETKIKMSAASKDRRHSEKSRAKMSATRTGRLVTPETRAKLSTAARSRQKTLTPETRAKMSAAHMGQRPSAETRAKLSAAKKGKQHTQEHIAKRAAARRKNNAEKKIKILGVEY